MDGIFNVAFILFITAPVLANQMVALNITAEQKPVKVNNSSVAKRNDVTICARFLVEPSARTEIFTLGPLSLRSEVEPGHAVDQMIGEVFYMVPTMYNSPSKTFAVWAPGVWNHICVSFSDKDCGVRVVLNGQTVVDSMMQPCYGFHRNASLKVGSNMIGVLTDVNLWEEILSKKEAKEWTQCILKSEGRLVAWSRVQWGGNSNPTFVATVDVCKSPPTGQILSYEPKMLFDENMKFCRFMGGKITTFAENKTMTRVNEMLEGHHPKWALTGYILDEKENPINTYTGQ